MAVIAVLGAKGGCGASLTATNLSVALARDHDLILFDLNPLRGCDDMLLGLSPPRAWSDLLPVARELKDSQLRKVLFPSQSRLGLLPAPEILLESEAYPRVEELIVGLQRRSSLLIIDLASGDAGLTGSVLHACDLILLVSTPDAPALRAASRWRGVFPPEEHTGAGLILNQMSRDHPMRPNAVATSLSLPLLGVLPKDMEAVGSQIAFGQPAVLSQGSPLGRAMLALATRVSQQLGVLGRKLKAAGSSPPPHTAGGIQEDASS